MMLCACSPSMGEAETGVSLELACYLMRPNPCTPGSMRSLPQKHVVGRDEARHLTSVSGLNSHKHTHAYATHTLLNAHKYTYAYMTIHSISCYGDCHPLPFLLASPLTPPPVLLCPPSFLPSPSSLLFSMAFTSSLLGPRFVA